MGRGAWASSSGGVSFGSHWSQRHPARQLRTVPWADIQDVSGFRKVLVNAGAGGVNVTPAARQREDKTMLRPVSPRRRLGWPGDLVSGLGGRGLSSP
jgi:hypothetical protein